MIHTDGRATISSVHGDPLAGIASKRADDLTASERIRAARVGAPEHVRKSVSELIVDEEDTTLNFAAWRTLKNLNEALSSESITTLEQALVVVRTLEATYEGLYRASQ